MSATKPKAKVGCKNPKGSQQRVGGRREQAPERKWWRLEEWTPERETWREIERYPEVKQAFEAAQWCFDSYHRDAPKRRWRVVQLVETPSPAVGESPTVGG
jgi:hypothetical protein